MMHNKGGKIVKFEDVFCGEGKCSEAGVIIDRLCLYKLLMQP